jgi:hypothetical protein
VKPVFIMTIWIGVAAAFWIANYVFPQRILLNMFYTFSSLAAIYLIFRIILHDRLSRLILEEIDKSDKMEIATETLDKNILSID